MPPRYIRFTVLHKCFWTWLNIFNILTSIAMAVGWVMISGHERDQNTLSYQECQSMGVVCWALFTLHACNCIFSMMALCGLEKRICISHVLLALVVYDGVVLIWSQAVYFKSQNYNCNLEMGDVYFWLMGEILFFYCLTAFVICYFFRKFCQDPGLKKAIEEQELADLNAVKQSALTDDKVMDHTPGAAD